MPLPLNHVNSSIPSDALSAKCTPCTFSMSNINILTSTIILRPSIRHVVLDIEKNPASLQHERQQGHIPIAGPPLMVRAQALLAIAELVKDRQPKKMYTGYSRVNPRMGLAFGKGTQHSRDDRKEVYILLGVSRTSQPFLFTCTPFHSSHAATVFERRLERHRFVGGQSLVL